MKRTLMLTGDVNLMNVTDPRGPFARVRDTLRQADVLFGNLECCFYEPPAASMEREGSMPRSPRRGPRIAGITRSAPTRELREEAIRSRSGDSTASAFRHRSGSESGPRAPTPSHPRGALSARATNLRLLADGHEATDQSPGVAVLTGHTAYEPPLHTRRAGVPPANRPGVPPAILTWADAKSLAEFTGDLRALRTRADIVVASHHWGLFEDVLDYQVEIAHAAIDAGADVVMGHGPHYACAVEMYQGKPIFYGLGSFSFHTGHGGQAHGDWVGMLARLTFDDRALVEVAFSMVRPTSAGPSRDRAGQARSSRSCAVHKPHDARSRQRDGRWRAVRCLPSGGSS